jgi:transposase-like protein
MNTHTYKQSCPNPDCDYYKKSNQKNILIHDKKLRRLRCNCCGKTWSAHHNEIYYRLHSDPTKIDRALIMISLGTSVRRVARLIDVSSGTVMRWKKFL